MGVIDPLDGYVHGPAAAVAATGLALAKVVDPAAMILVEGISDQIAVEALAARRGRDLVEERIAVVPIGGAQAIARFRRDHPGVAVALCDAAEQEWFLRVLAPADVFTCTPDLEGELIRAVGVDAIRAILDEQGDLRRFTTLQKQAAWNDQPAEAQLRRFFGAGARRKLRYARLLVDAAVDVDRVPAPLDGVLGAVG
ncbi:MAG TPA: TOPRIM nucleotidyl transferase/hydrolase domain-containing protein [Ilumatobacter sp.]|nr:TOPRIM nucleotidyl transferase/hydrolase domain-containing protein [Ilumatobacter sp.]